MSDALPVPPKEHSLLRRPWLIAGGVAIMLLGALAFFFFKDDAPPEDADFIPEWTEGGGPRNPLVVFIEEVRSFKGKPGQSVQDLELGYGYKPEDEPLMEELVAKNAFVLVAFERLMATDPALWRWPGDRGISLPFAVDSDSCEDITLGVLWTKINLLIRKGERQQAARLAVAVHDFGQGLLKAEGGYFYHRQALDIQTVARLGVMGALEHETSPDFLKLVQEEISGNELQTADLIQRIKRDHLLMKSAIAAIIHDDEAFATLCLNRPTFSKIWLRPNRTLRLDLQYRRELTAALESGAWGKAHKQSEAFFDAVSERTKKLLHPLMNSNVFGQTQWKEWLHEDLVIDAATHVNNHRMLVTSLAIRRYELSHNALPKTLQDLVPEFLPAVPVDALNRLPIEWDPAKRELLARGLPQTEPVVFGRTWDGDIKFPLWWKAP